MPFGNRLKEARLKRGFTQEELAKAIGVSKGSIGNYESEISSPKEEILIKLIKVLDIEPNFLYQDLIHMHSVSSEDSNPAFLESSIKRDVELSSDENHLVTTYRSLTPYGKQLMMDRAAELTRLYGEKESSSGSSNLG